METGKTEPAPNRELRRSSDALLDAVRALHEMEREKRAQEVSTPKFHAMARQITERSRDVFRLAAEEELEGDEIDSPQGKTTEDIRP